MVRVVINGCFDYKSQTTLVIGGLLVGITISCVRLLREVLRPFA